ncbi:MAG: hypothetical protein HQK91_02100 [Nitrospirae bacterium]|nr:hypothetical protein [Nitrospirota bacterium]MBF0540227.1 hypothetical protein [Nitrospirota bacterium]
MKRFTVLTTVFALAAFLVCGSISFAADKTDDKGAAVKTTVPAKGDTTKAADQKVEVKKAVKAPKKTDEKK